MDHDFILSGNAARTLLNRNASDRRKAIQYFDNLADNPTQEGDFQERGESGRIYEVKIFENFIITYWADHSSKELRIVLFEVV